jgi:hypothetical protein
VQQKRLRTRRDPSVDGLIIARRLLIDCLDLGALRQRQIGLWSAPLVCWVSVCEWPGPRLPDASFNPILMRQSEPDDSREVRAEFLVQRSGRRPGPARGIKSIAIVNQVARMCDNGFSAFYLRFGRLAIELNEQHTDRNARDKRQEPKSSKTKSERAQRTFPCGRTTPISHSLANVRPRPRRLRNSLE